MVGVSEGSVENRQLITDNDDTRQEEGELYNVSVNADYDNDEANDDANDDAMTMTKINNDDDIWQEEGEF